MTPMEEWVGVVIPAGMISFNGLFCPRLAGHRDAYPTCEVVDVQLCYSVAKLIYLCKER
jgi:hypothetical protein